MAHQEVRLQKTHNVGFVNSTKKPSCKKRVLLYNIIMENLVSELKNRLHSLESLTAIDCGCGEGEKAFLLAREGAAVTAFDKNEELLTKVRKSAKDLGLKIKTKQALVEEYKSKKKFDIVLFMYVLHFIEEKRKALENVIELAQEGGVVVFSDLEDNRDVDLNYIEYLKENLTDIKEERFEINDEPHTGYPQPHRHKIYILIGTKK